MLHSLLNQTKSNKGHPSGEWKIISPAKPDQVLEVCQYWYSDIELAVQGADAIQSKLSTLSFSERKALVQKACEKVGGSKTTLLASAQSELGRTELDLEFEWAEVVRFLKSLSALHLSGEHDPRGVVAVLGSSVWPLFYSLQYLFLNFLAGNAVVLKPSEKTTLTVLRLLELIRSVDPIFHSLQLLVGEKEVGRRLACHELVSAVIFQGSFEMGMRVRQDTLSQPSKEVFLFLGAKNPAVVFQDAPASVDEVLLADCFSGAGQDCHSTSVILVEESFLDTFTARFHALSKEFKIGGPSEKAFMGPLIDAAIMDRYFKFIGISEREGAEILMRGKPLKVPGGGHYVTPTLALFRNVTPEQMKKSVSLQTEILSPHVSLIGFKDEEDLKALLKAMNHGKSASLWTSDLDRATRIARAIDFGQIQINRSMRERADVSFQARKRSGNHAQSGNTFLSQLQVLRSIRS